MSQCLGDINDTSERILCISEWHFFHFLHRTALIQLICTHIRSIDMYICRYIFTHIVYMLLYAIFTCVAIKILLGDAVTAYQMYDVVRRGASIASHRPCHTRRIMAEAPSGGHMGEMQMAVKEPLVINNFSTMSTNSSQSKKINTV